LQNSVTSSAGHPQKKPSQISIEDITPEVAAHVVKNYLLPMFESDIKKGLRKTLKGKTSPGKETNTQSIDQTNSVYGELKLSE
jgi:hypothetical protein